ncbi:hypothetical protein ACXR0O_14255 [Verrucomicrobiota bacterium sgz303538]
MNEKDRSTVSIDGKDVVFVLLFLIGTYLFSYYVLPRPDPLSSIKHPTALSRAYYRLYYPLRHVTTRYTKSHSGTVEQINFTERELLLRTTPTCGLPFQFRAHHEAFLRTLKTGDRINILVEAQPDPDAPVSHLEILSISR